MLVSPRAKDELVARPGAERNGGDDMAEQKPMEQGYGDLDLAPIGNCSVSALVDRNGRFVWACAPRVDGDPLFCALLSGEDPASMTRPGQWAIELEGQIESRQTYERNSAVLKTHLIDAKGGAIEITDFCPRYRHYNRIFRPVSFARLVKPVAGAPRIRVRLEPATDYGARPCDRTWGSNHIRYVGSQIALRMTTNAPVGHIVHGRTFRAEGEYAFFLGPDETFAGDVLTSVRLMAEETNTYWREWVRTLALPLQWQQEVIRAAIALKLCVFEETGAIVAALTTSVPEAPGSGRNWDYRYCWLRDAYYTVQALNRLGAVDILEGFLSYLRNIIDQSTTGHIQPVYGVGYEPGLDEWTVATLPGFRGMGPVRAGNQAHEHFQHDVYGQIVLSSVQAFFDQRLLRPVGLEDFEHLERVGERAFAMHDQPDAGLWEFRGRARVHTYSSLMCWAACDRLANAAGHIGLTARATYWRERAEKVRTRIDAEAWSEALGRYSASFGGSEVDASLLQLIETRYMDPMNPRFLATLEAVEKALRRGPHLLRYDEPDDFGAPETAFNFCTFWFIEALARTGRAEEARELFEQMLARRTNAGLLSEDADLETGTLWGNYPQTYSLVGLINCAGLLSPPWTSVR
jgi:pentatricopeptide repeat protein